MNQEHIWGKEETQFFFHLEPHLILKSIDCLGMRTTGRCLALNSMENRVYEIEIEDPEDRDQSQFVVAKFYRPGRWTQEQILDEHNFLLELAQDEIPVIAPLQFEGKTLFQVPGHKLWYTVFPRKGGRIPDEMDDEKLEIIGRLLARIHNVGARKKARHRLLLNPTIFGLNNLRFLIDSKKLPEIYRPIFQQTIEQICQFTEPLFANTQSLRIHGDCHRSNIIYREDQGPFFVDFDDMVMGPAVQDIWLIVPGDDEQAREDRTTLLSNYELMRSFDYSSLRLIEPLRALRYIHFAAWMAKRWDDPAFQRAFPYFGSERYWSELSTDLQLQLEKIKHSLYNPTY